MPTDVRRRVPGAPSPAREGDPLLSRLLTPKDGLPSPVTGKRRAARGPADLGAIWSIARKTAAKTPR
jgi:hypothetical protein